MGRLFLNHRWSASFYIVAAVLIFHRTWAAYIYMVSGVLILTSSVWLSFLCHRGVLIFISQLGSAYFYIVGRPRMSLNRRWRLILTSVMGCLFFHRWWDAYFDIVGA